MTFDLNFVQFPYFLWHFTQAFNYTPLITAAKSGYSEIVQYLLSCKGVDVNYRRILIIYFFYEIYIKYFHGIKTFNYLWNYI